MYEELQKTAYMPQVQMMIHSIVVPPVLSGVNGNLCMCAQLCVDGCWPVYVCKGKRVPVCACEWPCFESIKPFGEKITIY